MTQRWGLYRRYGELHGRILVQERHLHRDAIKVLSPPTNKPGNIDEMDNVSIISFHHGPGDDDMLRGVQDYTAHIDFNNDMMYDHIISSCNRATR